MLVLLSRGSKSLQGRIWFWASSALNEGEEGWEEEEKERVAGASAQREVFKGRASIYHVTTEVSLP